MRQVRLDDEREVGQIDAARGDVRRDAHPRPPVAHLGQRLVALGLRQFAGQRHDAEAALLQCAGEPGDAVARGAEHDRRARIVPAQQIDDRLLDLVAADPDALVLDVGMTAFLAGDFEPDGAALVASRETGDPGRDGRREQQRAPLRRGGLQDELDVLAEAEVQHLVSLVEDHRARAGEHELPRSMWSRMRPGVPTTMSAPASSVRFSRTGSMPPTAVATRAPALP